MYFHPVRRTPVVDLDEQLLEAAQAGNLAAVTAALKNGANVDARDAGFGRTALMTASMHSAIPIMQALLDAGAGLNLRAALGETALILAASGRGGESIELLLTRGADPNLADREKKTPLMWTVDTQFHRGVDTAGSIAPLVDAGARINDVDANGRTVLMWAVMGIGTSFDVRHTVLAKLVEHDADVNATESNGETAMFGLVRYIDDALALDAGPRCIQVLTNAGADRNAVNDAGKTPLAVVNRNNPLVIELLRNLGFTE
jgi:ankyrin repeat protein